MAIVPPGPQSGLRRARFILSPGLTGALGGMSAIAYGVGPFEVFIVLGLMAVATIPVGMSIGLAHAIKHTRRRTSSDLEPPS